MMDNKMPTLIESFRAARLRGVPIVAVSTPDQSATVAALHAAETERDKDAPLVVWDIVNGIRPLNSAGTSAVIAAHGIDPTKFNTDADPKYKEAVDAESRRLGRRLTEDECRKIKEAREVAIQHEIKKDTIDPDAALFFAKRLPGAHDSDETLGSVLFMHNAHAVLRDDFPTKVAVRQAVANLRDAYKASSRMLVLLGPDIELPAELSNDVIPLKEEYPDVDRLRDIVLEQFRGAGLSEPDAETITLCVDALRGIAAFPAEQITAMSLKRGGIDLPMLWERKRTEIEKVRGLTVHRGTVTLDSVGGKAQLVKLARRYFEGPNRPRFILVIDEIDKDMAGATHPGGADQTAADQHGTLLRVMEDHKYPGLLLVSPPGCGKTEFAKALGATFKVMSASLDLGALLEKWVGSSQEHIRNVFRLLYAIAGPGGVLVIGTCNKLENLSPEMRRRFRLGIWFDDLPTPEERDTIWGIKLREYGLPLDSPRPDDYGWTGSDIRNCCDLAFSLKCSLREAAEFLVPVSKSNPQMVERLRDMAKDSFLSTAYPGPYKGPEVETESTTETPAPAPSKASAKPSRRVWVRDN